jgi:hypothetical protein
MKYMIAKKLAKTSEDPSTSRGVMLAVVYEMDSTCSKTSKS